MLFALILVLTSIQRWFLRDKDESARKKALREQRRSGEGGMTDLEPRGERCGTGWGGGTRNRGPR